MNEPKFTPDDPTLTAYALGELSGDERAAVEAALRENPELRAAVESIRLASAQIEAALAAETVEEDFAAHTIRDDTPAATPRVSLPAEPAGAGRRRAPAGPREYRQPTGGGRLLAFPQFYYVAGIVAAACFSILVAYHRPTHEARERQKAARAVAAVNAAPEVARSSVALDAGPDAGRSPAVAASDPLTMPAQPESLVQNDLTLLGQGRREELRAEPDRVALQPAPEPAAPTESPRPLVASASPVAPARANAEPAPIPASPGSPAAAGHPDEIVMLGTFTVAADREPAPVLALAGAYTTAPREGSGLPPRPRGARFGRPGEAYAYARDNDFLSPRQAPSSTFAVDVDTASYANIRRFIDHGMRPPRDSVRIEEMLNYFPYRYVAPKDEVFAVATEIAEAPWAPGHRLVRVAIKGRDVPALNRAPANLVFLLDVSSSMNEPNKLPLVKESLRQLLGRLRPDDQVAIVTYAGQSGLALPSTPAARSAEILRALERLAPNGSGSGTLGIRLAYDIAKANYVADGINRVILCTDGDFKVGAPTEIDLERLVEERARGGVLLTALGFGMGNVKDATLERLADRGNGSYGYIDTRRDAEKLLLAQIDGSLVTIAKDVRIQIDFNELKVASYRLIGYENRVLRREDFADTEEEPGEVKAGHALTALYEIVPAGVAARPQAVAAIDEQRWGSSDAFSSRLAMPNAGRGLTDELLTVKVRYKKPNALLPLSTTLEFPVADAGAAFAAASADFRFAAAVAQYGMILRESPHRGHATLGDVLAWAANAATRPGDDPGGHRGQFIDLVRKTQTLLQ